MKISHFRCMFTNNQAEDPRRNHWKEKETFGVLPKISTAPVFIINREKSVSTQETEQCISTVIPQTFMTHTPHDSRIPITGRWNID